MCDEPLFQQQFLRDSAFDNEETPLEVEPQGVADQASALAHHAMAGEYNL